MRCVKCGTVNRNPNGNISMIPDEQINHLRHGLRAAETSIDDTIKRLRLLQTTVKAIGIQLDRVLDPYD